MGTILSEYYRHKEDSDLVLRILKDDAGVISVCSDDEQSTVFHLTREELEFNFTPTERPDRDVHIPQEEPKT